MSKTIFILGGARSGKSRFALELGKQQTGTKIYLATAEPRDAEMSTRIKQHQQERSADWETVEEPLHLSETLQALEGRADVILIDCLTLWLSNLMMDKRQSDQILSQEIDPFIDSVAKRNTTIIAVSNEVGQGIVPADPLARRFRDLSGLLHQKYAAIAEDVYFMTAGIPQKIKGNKHE